MVTHGSTTPDGTTTRTAVVIGAARPFGREIVEALKADGYAVVLADDAAAFAALPAEALDAFVLNTPVAPSSVRFRDVTDDQLIAALTDQLFELVAAGQAAAARLKTGGRIVHVASRAHLGAWGGAHQIAAGGALVGMTRSMAMELAAQDIGVNALAPDFVGGAWDTPEARRELAAAVAFFAGPDSHLVSGETVLLEQGRSLRMTEAARR